MARCAPWAAFLTACLVMALEGCSSDDDSTSGASGASGAAAAGGVGGAAASSGASSGGASGAGAGGAGAAGQAGSAGAPDCTPSDVQTILDEPDVFAQRFAYPSGGLKVFGEACSPKKAGPLPLLVWNHGGFWGLGAGDRDLCTNIAKNLGWAVVMSEYRGEGGSEGSPEVCLGEVDDVLALTACAVAHPEVDPARIVMAGGSHGGCITLRAFERSAPVVAAVDIFGPTDMAKEHEFLKLRLAADPTGQYASIYQQLIALLEQVTGGTPAQAPAEYAERSPIGFATDLAAQKASLLAVHGVEDALVSPAQSCALAQAAGGFEARHYDATATTPLTTPPAGCEATALTWLATPKPSPAWPGSRQLVVYDGAGHDLSPSVPGQAALVEDFLTFLVAKMPP